MFGRAKQLQELPEFDTDQIRFGHADVPNKTLFVAEIEKKYFIKGFVIIFKSYNLVFIVPSLYFQDNNGLQFKEITLVLRSMLYYLL